MSGSLGWVVLCVVWKEGWHVRCVCCVVRVGNWEYCVCVLECVLVGLCFFWVGFECCFWMFVCFVAVCFWNVLSGCVGCDVWFSDLSCVHMV